MSDNYIATTGTITVPTGYVTTSTGTSITIDASSWYGGTYKEVRADAEDKTDEGDDKGPVTFELKEAKVIKDNNGKERKVVVTLKNGDVFTATCSSSDEFNLEYGITIALLKAALAHLDSDNPSRDLSKGVRQCVKLIEDGIKKEAEAEEEKNRIKRRKEKARLKKQKRMEKRKEESIYTQKEAFLRALKELEEYKNEPQAKGRG